MTPFSLSKLCCGRYDSTSWTD